MCAGWSCPQGQTSGASLLFFYSTACSEETRVLAQLASLTTYKKISQGTSPGPLLHSTSGYWKFLPAPTPPAPFSGSPVGNEEQSLLGRSSGNLWALRLTGLPGIPARGSECLRKKGTGTNRRRVNKSAECVCVDT